MLKVTVIERDTERRVLVEGALAGASAAELESVWSRIRASRDGRKIVVDLTETTIDADGKRILLAMASEGAELVAEGVYTGFVVRGLVEKVNAGCRS